MIHLFSTFSGSVCFTKSGRVIFNESRRDFLTRFRGGDVNLNNILGTEAHDDGFLDEINETAGGHQSRRKILKLTSKTAIIAWLTAMVPSSAFSQEKQVELEGMSEENFMNEVLKILDEFVPEHRDTIFKVMGGAEQVKSNFPDLTDADIAEAFAEGGHVHREEDHEEGGHGHKKRENFWNDPEAAEGKEYITLAADIAGAGSFVHAISLWVQQKQIGIGHYLTLLASLGTKYAAGNKHKRKHLKEEWKGGGSSLAQMFMFASLFKGEFLKDIDWSVYSEDQIAFSMTAIAHLVAPFNTTFGGSVITAPMLAELTKRWNARGLNQEEINTKTYKNFVHNPNLAGIWGIGDYPFLKVVQDIGWKKLLPFQFGNPVENGISDTIMDAWIASLLYQQYQLAPDDLSKAKKLAWAMKSFTKKENWKALQDTLGKLVPLRSIVAPVKAAKIVLDRNKTWKDKGAEVGSVFRQAKEDGKEFLTPMAEDMKYSFGLAKGIFTGNQIELQRSAVMEMINPIVLNQALVKYEEDKGKTDLIIMLKDPEFWDVFRTKLKDNEHVMHAKHDIEKFGNSVKPEGGMETAEVIESMLSGAVVLTDNEWAKIASDLKQGQVNSAASKLGKFLSTEVLKDIPTSNKPSLIMSSVAYFFNPKYAAERLTPFLGMTSAEMVGVLPKQVGAIAAMVDMLSRFEVFVEHLEPLMGKVRARAYYAAVTNYVISSVAENYTGFSVGAELIKKLVGPLLDKDPSTLKIDDPDLKPLFTVFYYISIIGGFSNLLGDFGPHMALITPLVDKSKGFPNIIESAKANAGNSALFSAYAVAKLELAIAEVNKVLNNQEVDKAERAKMIEEIDGKLNEEMSRFLLDALIKKYEGKSVPKDVKPLLDLLDTTLRGGEINENIINEFIKPDKKDSKTGVALKNMLEKKFQE
jgi:hypothetical protein